MVLFADSQKATLERRRRERGKCFLCQFVEREESRFLQPSITLPPPPPRFFLFIALPSFSTFPPSLENGIGSKGFKEILSKEKKFGKSDVVECAPEKTEEKGCPFFPALPGNICRAVRL